MRLKITYPKTSRPDTDYSLAFEDSSGMLPSFSAVLRPGETREWGGLLHQVVERLMLILHKDIESGALQVAMAAEVMDGALPTVVGADTVLDAYMTVVIVEQGTTPKNLALVATPEGRVPGTTFTIVNSVTDTKDVTFEVGPSILRLSSKSLTPGAWAGGRMTITSDTAAAPRTGTYQIANNTDTDLRLKDLLPTAGGSGDVNITLTGPTGQTTTIKAITASSERAVTLYGTDGKPTPKITLDKPGQLLSGMVLNSAKWLVRVSS